MNKVCCIGLMFSASLWAQHDRDPFQPPQDVPCVYPNVSPEGWRFKGTIGTSSGRYAWVETPQGQWLRLLPQQQLLAGHWQVVKILPRQLELGIYGMDGNCSARIGNVILTLGEKQIRKEK